MSRRAQAQVLVHGAIVLLIGLLDGFPYSSAIVEGWGDDAVRAWHTAHIGVSLGGIWLIAVAGALHLVTLGARMSGLMAGALIASGYGFAFALSFGAMVGERGLTPTAPLMNVVVFLGNTIGAVGSLVGLALMLAGAVRTLGVTTEAET